MRDERLSTSPDHGLCGNPHRVDDRPRSGAWRARLLPIVLIAIAIVAAAALFADRYRGLLRDQAVAAGQADTMVQTRAALRLLESELQKFRLLPVVLGEYPDLRAALASGKSNRTLDAKLALLSERTGAPAIYALDRRGIAISASNAGRPDSFVGQDYRFRPYFQQAWRRGASEYFALGTVSRRPGLYLARRIDSGGAPIGVIVVKVEFDAIEQAWAERKAATFVADADGVLLLSSDRAWRFRTLGPVSEPRKAQMRRDLQFGDAPLAPIGIAIGPDGRAVMPDRSSALVAELPVPVAGWRLFHFEPLDARLRLIDQRAVVAGLLCAVLLAMLAAAFGWSNIRRRRAADARAHLEAEVARRTADLAQEIDARVTADQRYRQAREELAHANRLGTLGTISAGVAHEINQPVATIRTFAENASAFLARAQPEQVAGNLREIVAMTDRIGSITAELRRYARRGVGTAGPVVLAEVIDGVGLLIGDRFRSAGVALDLPVVDAQLRVHAGRVRLEQVIVNLLQNALDAVEGRAAPAVSLIIVEFESRIAIDVRDNGPGIAPDMADRLFMPFATSKAGGLGLGLHIARDIMIEFGGTLDHLPAEQGTVFRLTLEGA